MKIDVALLGKDIDRGVKLHSTKCPVYWALKRIGFKAFEVGYTGIFKKNKNVSPKPSIPTTPQLRKFISSFDGGKIVAPFIFTLDAPKKVLAEFGYKVDK